MVKKRIKDGDEDEEERMKCWRRKRRYKGGGWRREIGGGDKENNIKAKLMLRRDEKRVGYELKGNMVTYNEI